MAGPLSRASRAAGDHAAMPVTRDPTLRLGWLMSRHQAIHDPVRDPRNGLPWLPEVRRWQARRLECSFQGFLRDPRRAPAARFFLSDVYNEGDFRRRDRDIARVLPLMQRLLPGALLGTLADAMELGVLSHALDLRLAQRLARMAPPIPALDAVLYAEAYRQSGLPRLRRHQIDLVTRVGCGLGRGLRIPGVSGLLKLSRGPARAAGVDELQGFLERGYAAFSHLDDVGAFIGDIEREERALARRLFAGDPDPFRGCIG